MPQEGGPDPAVRQFAKVAAIDGLPRVRSETLSVVTTQQHVAVIRRLSRERVIHELLHFQGAVQLDFTEAFLSGMSDGKLRHLLLAVYTHGRPHRASSPDAPPEPAD